MASTLPSLDSFDFSNPVKLIFGFIWFSIIFILFIGKDSVEKLIPVIKADGIKKVLLLFGSGSVKSNGVYNRVIKNLRENKIDSVFRFIYFIFFFYFCLGISLGSTTQSTY
jgi:alcohol dehydrogenase YqhD (iron-dependent ADH family)